MNRFLKYGMITVFGLGAVSNVLMVDKERKPITAGVAAATVVVNGLIVVCLLRTPTR